MVEQWNPWFEWIMDLLKFAITFGVSALMTVLVINRVQERRARQRSRADALFQLQMDALREFRRTAATYEVAALSAYTDIYQWRGGEKTAAMQRYEGTAFGDFTAALDGLGHRFEGNTKATQLIKDLRQAHKIRHKMYDRLVDLQLDSDPELDMRQHAHAKRKDFNELLSQATRLRQDIISVVETDILTPE